MSNSNKTVNPAIIVIAAALTMLYGGVVCNGQNQSPNIDEIRNKIVPSHEIRLKYEKLKHDMSPAGIAEWKRKQAEEEAKAVMDAIAKAKVDADAAQSANAAAQTAADDAAQSANVAAQSAADAAQFANTFTQVARQASDDAKRAADAARAAAKTAQEASTTAHTITNDMQAASDAAQATGAALRVKQAAGTAKQAADTTKQAASTAKQAAERAKQARKEAEEERNRPVDMKEALRKSGFNDYKNDGIMRQVSMRDFVQFGNAQLKDKLRDAQRDYARADAFDKAKAQARVDAVEAEIKKV